MIYTYTQQERGISFEEDSHANKVLRTVCREVEVEDIPLVKIISETLRKELYGTSTRIAIAANQCGFNLRVILMNIGRFKDTIMINPQIVKARGDQKFEEGCLSFPGLKIKKVRPAILNIRFKNESLCYETHKINGLEAVCFSHELDHLNGKLLIDN